MNLEVKVNTRMKIIYVTTSGRYPHGTQGLLGSPHNSGLISRDGVKMSNKDVNSEKLKALKLTMEKLDKTYGKGSVMKLGDAPVEKVEVIPL